MSLSREEIIERLELYIWEKDKDGNPVLNIDSINFFHNKVEIKVLPILDRDGVRRLPNRIIFGNNIKGKYKTE